MNKIKTNECIRDKDSDSLIRLYPICGKEGMGFLRDYIDIPMLKDVRPEDIEDVTERFVHMFTEERNSDVVKKVRIRSGKIDEIPFYFILVC